MSSLNDKGHELISQAQNAIRLNYDAVGERHTVGAAVRCKSGKIYTGVNVYSVHGACAEQIAIRILFYGRRGLHVCSPRRLRTKNCRAFCPLFQFVRV